MNIRYLVPRLIRHFLPERLTRFLLRRSLVIKPGLETVDAAAAADRYLRVLAERGRRLAGMRVLVLGYGGRIDIGLSLLDAGAGHVALWDRYAPPDDRHNARMLERRGVAAVLPGSVSGGLPKNLELVRADIRDVHPADQSQEQDLVISNSVYEHLDDPAGTTQALARWTGLHGLNIHYVDLRDHFFRFPFEMLRFREMIWRRWLNPTSNHNRLRIWDYERIFASGFGQVQVEVLERDEAAFRKAENHIRSEFKTGAIDRDSVTLLRIVAAAPLR